MRVRIAVILLAAACGPEAEERAALDDVCGHPSPFRVLELGDLDVPSRMSLEANWFLPDDDPEESPNSDLAIRAR